MIIYFAAVLEKDVEENLARIAREKNLFDGEYRRMMTFAYRKDVETLIGIMRREDGEAD